MENKDHILVSSDILDNPKIEKLTKKDKGWIVYLFWLAMVELVDGFVDLTRIEEIAEKHKCKSKDLLSIIYDFDLYRIEENKAYFNDNTIIII